jgi:hypothetical protein
LDEAPPRLWGAPQQRGSFMVDLSHDPKLGNKAFSRELPERVSVAMKKSPLVARLRSPLVAR